MKIAKLAAGFVLAAAALLARSASVEASPEYPGDLQTDLGLPMAPPCTLCHVGTPGITTATTPFAESMQAAGLVAENPASLEAAIESLAENNIDSDGDGTPDITEISEGQSPNGPGSLYGVSYGCGARIAPEPPNLSAGAMAAALLALFVARRRRR